MIVLANSEGLAVQAFGGEAKQRGLDGVVCHWFLVDEPVTAVPGPARKARVLPVCVGVDEVHITLGIEPQRPEDNRTGYERLAAEFILDKVSHIIEVGLFCLGQKSHSVEDTSWALTIGSPVRPTARGQVWSTTFWPTTGTGTTRTAATPRGRFSLGRCD